MANDSKQGGKPAGEGAKSADPNPNDSKQGGTSAEDQVAKLQLQQELLEEQQAELKETRRQIAELQSMMQGAVGDTLAKPVAMPTLAESMGGEVPTHKQKYVRDYHVFFEGDKSDKYIQPVLCEDFSGSGAVSRVLNHLGLDGAQYFCRSECQDDEYALTLADHESVKVAAKSPEDAAKMIEASQRIPVDPKKLNKNPELIGV